MQQASANSFKACFLAGFVFSAAPSGACTDMAVFVFFPGEHREMHVLSYFFHRLFSLESQWELAFVHPLSVLSRAHTSIGAHRD
ncbi:MAG: hypothetical protein H6935_13080 [Thiobacillus sp.]|nr:hypothetical protein [Thiobacillus sp.]